MSMDEYPDYDLSFLDGTTGSDLAALGRGLENSASDLQRRTGDVTGNAAGETVTRVHADLVDIKQSLDQSAAAAAAAAAAFQAMKAAWNAWKANAPKHAELVAAEQEVERRKAALKAADNHHAALHRAALREAQEKLKHLIEKREAADHALADALESAQADLEFAARSGVSNEEKRSSPGTPAPAPKPAEPGTPAPTPAPVPAPGAAAPAPAPAPGAALPGTSAAPETGLSASTPPKSTSSDSALAAAALSQALSRPQQAAAAPQQQQMPAMPQIPAAAAAPQVAGGNTRPENDRERTGVSLEDLVADGALPASVLALGAGAPLAAASVAPATVAAPWTAPATVTPAPAISYPGLSGLSGAAATPPPVNPTVTGTSIQGLQTSTDVSGRSEPPRTAFAPAPGAGAGTATHLAGGGIGGPGAAGAASTMAGTGVGTPMIPPMMGGPMCGGGAAGRHGERDQILQYTPDEAVAHGMHAVAEAVPGGTVAQRRGDLPGADDTDPSPVP